MGSTSENLARLARCNVLVVAGELSPKGVPEMAEGGELTWTDEAEARLRQVPDGVMRELTRERVEVLARRLGQSTITPEILEAKYLAWAEGSVHAAREMAWSEEALRRIERIPSFVRGMVGEAIEAYANHRGLTEISPEIVDEARRHWEETGRFHRP
jgi:hypothetical protein